MHKPFFSLNTWILPVVAGLGLCSLCSNLIAQSPPSTPPKPSLTIEAVLRGVQERKLMLAIKDAVKTELTREVGLLSDGGTLPLATADLPLVDLNKLIKWPDGIDDSFPANDSITDLPTALTALNLALAVYYESIEPAYLTIPAGQTTLQNSRASKGYHGAYEEKQMPPISKFTEANWRDNLRLFASRIEQLQTLYWPTLGSRTYGGCMWSDWSYENGSNHVREPSGSVLVSPSKTGADLGGVSGNWCNKGVYYQMLEDDWNPALSWGINTTGTTDSTSSYSTVRSELSFLSGIKTKTIPTLGVGTISGLPADKILNGSIEYYRGGGYQWGDATYSHVKGQELNESLARLYPDSWSVNRVSKITLPGNASQGTDVAFGDLEKLYSEDSSDLDNEFTKMLAWMQLPTLTFTSSWEKITDSETLYRYNSGSWEDYWAGVRWPNTTNDVTGLWRLKIGGISLENPAYFSQFAYPNRNDGSGWSCGEMATMALFCIHRPNFTPLLPEVVKIIGGVDMDAGAVTLMPRTLEPVRVHLGRGKNDRQQGGWLSLPLDGFGPMEFKGSFDAFEVLYETNPALYQDSPLPLPSGGNAKSFNYLRSDEFTSAQISASAGFPFVDPNHMYRQAYMERWAKSRLRQVKGQDVLVDISYISGYKKELKFYWASQLGARNGNLYAISAALKPFKTITIENPTQASFTVLPTQHNKLKIIENGNLQHIIECSPVEDEDWESYTDIWKFTTTALGGGTTYSRTRTLKATFSYTLQTSVWDETVVENEVTWKSKQEFDLWYDPGSTDFPILNSCTAKQGNDTKTVEVVWDKKTPPDPYSWQPNLYWSPTSVTFNEGTQETPNLNEAKIEFDSKFYASVKKETRQVMRKELTVEHDWEDKSTHATTWMLEGNDFAVNKLTYSANLQTLTTATDGLQTVYTYGAPDGSMPWVLQKSVGPGNNGWQQDFTLAKDEENEGGGILTVVSGWGESHLGGGTTITKVNRFGGLVSQESETKGGLQLSKTTANEHTPWGAPRKLTHLGDRKEFAAFNTSSVANYGTLASATNVFGQQITVNEYDQLKRPKVIETGFESLTPDYSKPLERKVELWQGGPEQVVKINGFGEFRSSSNTEGSGSSITLGEGEGSVEVGSRPVPLKLTDSGEIESVGSGMGSRGSKVKLDVVNGRLRQTLTQLTQSDADHHQIRTYTDANGRLVKRESVATGGGTVTEAWDYPDVRTVIYTPGPGPVFQPVKRTLSTDGLTLTTQVGSRDHSRQRRTEEGGKLVLISEIYDDSSGEGDQWTVVSTETLDPTSGNTRFTPWDLSAEAVTQEIETDNASQMTVKNVAGSDTSNVILEKGMVKSVTGVTDGISFSVDSITREHGRLRSGTGKVAGKDMTFELDEDGRIKRLDGPGFDKHYVYGGAPAYQVTVNDTELGTTQVISASAVGDFTGMSGDGVQALSASTTDQAGGRTTTSISGYLSTQVAANGSVLSKNYEGGLQEDTTYNAEGLPTSAGTGPELQTLSYGNDGLSSTTSGSGLQVEETFFNVGLRSSISGNGEARSFTYLRMQKATEQHTDGPWAGRLLTYGQDERARRSSLNVSNEFSVAYSYSGGTSRLASLSFVGNDVNYGRDAESGQRATMQRGALSTSWSHDGVGREIAQATGGFVYGFNYDQRHRRSSRTASTGVGWGGLQYDAADRLLSATLSNGTTLTYQYDSRGNRLAGGSAATTYTVNALNQLGTRNTNTAALGYGVYGTVTPGARVRVFHPGAVDPDGGEELTVDTHGTYQGWWSAGSGGGSITRVTMLVRGTLPGQGSLVDGGPERKDAISEETVWAVIPAASETFVYDAAGRLIEDGTWTYAWDAAGHLTGLTRKAGTASDPQVVAETISYSYDCDGRRTGRTHRLTKGLGDAQKVTTKTSKVLWDGWLPVYEERKINETPQASRWFVWGVDVSGSLGGAGGIGGLVSIREVGGRTLLPVDDGLGNITALVDKATGNTIARYDYGPYGEDMGTSGEVDACPFGYQSKWRDAEAGLNYFGYRHYSPRLGRWLSRDPLGEAGGFNLYAYCEGDPVNKHDYLGMDTIDISHLYGGEALAQALAAQASSFAFGGPDANNPLLPGAWQISPFVAMGYTFGGDRGALYGARAVVPVVGASSLVVGAYAAPALIEGGISAYTSAQVATGNGLLWLGSEQAATWGTRAALVSAGTTMAYGLATGNSVSDSIKDGGSMFFNVGGTFGFGDPKLPRFRLPSWKPKWNPLNYQFDQTKTALPLFGTAGFKYVGPVANGEGSPLLNSKYFQDALAYVRMIKTRTGFTIDASQRERLIDNLRATRYNRLTPQAGRAHRRAFTTSLKNQEIAEWERQTGQVWPRYASDLFNTEGELLRKAGAPYDAHHVIENIYGGPHEWWNLTPARFPDEHQGGIHLETIMEKLFP